MFHRDLVKLIVVLITLRLDFGIPEFEALVLTLEVDESEMRLLELLLEIFDFVEKSFEIVFLLLDFDYLLLVRGDDRLES